MIYFELFNLYTIILIVGGGALFSFILFIIWYIFYYKLLCLRIDTNRVIDPHVNIKNKSEDFDHVSLASTNINGSISPRHDSTKSQIQSSVSKISDRQSRNLSLSQQCSDDVCEDQAFVGLVLDDNNQSNGKHENFFKISKEIVPPVAANYDSSQISRDLANITDHASKNKEFFRKLKEVLYFYKKTYQRL